MKERVKNLSGMQFGKLTVLPEYEIRNKKAYWKCMCECGRVLWVRGINLSYGTSKSCGHHKDGNIKHGMSHSRLYSIYYGMLQRCDNPKSSGYEYYGALGIKVCPEWRERNGFNHFYKWAINNGYEDNLTIDRINTNGDYEPSNCRWITNADQQKNTRRNRYINILHCKETVTDYARRNHINTKTVFNRLDSNWNIENLNDVTCEERKVEYMGKLVTLKELSSITGINVNTLHTRFTKGFTDEEIIKPRYSANKKAVCQYDTSGNYIGEYESSADAARKTGLSKSGILMCCKGKRKTCGGFIWKQKEIDFVKRIERSLHRKKGGGWIDKRGSGI